MLDFLASQCANVIVPDATPEAVRYYNSGNILWIVAQAWGFIVPLLFLITGFTGKLGTFSEKVGKLWYFGIVVYLILFTAISTLLNFPLDIYSDFIRQHAYGLSNQTLGRWFDNYWKGIAVSLITLIVFIWIFYLLLKKSPRRWWFYSSLVSTAIIFFMMVVQPIWIDPLFNKFGPMQNKELEAQILNLASRAGIQDSRVYEVDKSQDTKAINAYVIGMGSTKRIVLWDTLIQQMTPDQVLFVMGHEMGHYVLHHMWWCFGYMAALSFAVFYLTYRSANFLMRRYRARFGFPHLYNIASLPLLFLLTGFYIFLLTPLTNCFSRYYEHQADIFGLEITQDNTAAGEAFLVLQKQNLAYPRPGPIFNFWRNTHPSLGDRVDFFNTYCPWVDGQPLKYGEYFMDHPQK